MPCIALSAHDRRGPGRRAITPPRGQRAPGALLALAGASQTLLAVTRHELVRARALADRVDGADLVVELPVRSALVGVRRDVPDGRDVCLAPARRAAIDLVGADRGASVRGGRIPAERYTAGPALRREQRRRPGQVRDDRRPLVRGSALADGVERADAVVVGNADGGCGVGERAGGPERREQRLAAARRATVDHVPHPGAALLAP